MVYSTVATIVIVITVQAYDDSIAMKWMLGLQHLTSQRAKIYGRPVLNVPQYLFKRLRMKLMTKV